MKRRIDKMGILEEEENSMTRWYPKLEEIDEVRTPDTVMVEAEKFPDGDKIIGYGKLTHEESITEMYENNLRKFLRYNLKDVILCEHLDKKLSLADEFVTNSTIASCNLSDVFSESQIADSFIISHIEDDENIALFTQRESEGVGDFAGGYVWSKGGDLYGVKTDE